MRAVVQRVSRASVVVDGVDVVNIGEGLLVFLGVGREDSEQDSIYLAKKVLNLRIFEDYSEKMNLGIDAVGGAILVVSQFTLYGDCRKGRRPSYENAAAGDFAKDLYEIFIAKLTESGVPIKTGFFGDHMDISLVNSGPVTLLLDSAKAF